jgi:hypothetical protein
MYGRKGYVEYARPTEMGLRRNYMRKQLAHVPSTPTPPLAPRTQ